MEKITIEQALKLIEKHEELDIVNNLLIEQQKEVITALQEHIAELKEIVQKYLLKTVTL